MDGVLAMGYRTSNDESHVCVYCDIVVEAGQGVLLKYSPAQSDEAIVVAHLTDRISHETCVQTHGSGIDQEALIPVSEYNTHR